MRMTDLTGVAATAVIDSQTFTLSAPSRIAQNEAAGGSPLSMSGNGVLVPLTPFETATLRVHAANSWAPIVLTVDKDAAGGTVKLRWTGGVPPCTVRRAADAAFTVDVATPFDEQPGAAFDDPALNDGVDAFYLVR